MDSKQYSIIVKNNEPKIPLGKNLLKAFLTGGIICSIAQIIQIILIAFFNIPKEMAAAPTSSIMVILAIIITILGWYDKISQFGGAGSAVPITGFGNSMASAALEYKTEGYVLGVGGNMFKIAGPVIVYGAVSGFLVGILHYLWEVIF